MARAKPRVSVGNSRDKATYPKGTSPQLIDGGREHSYVALKVYTRDSSKLDELRAYTALAKADHSHPGRRHVRRAIDTFVLRSHGGQHRSLVQEPMWDSWKDLLRRNPAHRFTEDLLKAGLRHVLLGLDYLHSECKLVHTGRNYLYPVASSPS